MTGGFHLAAGDAARGRAVFERACAPCHVTGGLGHHVGPELTGLGHRSVEDLLTNILDPNMALNPAYAAYTAELADGELESGILAAETPQGVTLLQALGRRVEIPRTKLRQLRSDGRSLMPEGLEAGLRSGGAIAAAGLPAAFRLASGIRSAQNEIGPAIAGQVVTMKNPFVPPSCLTLAAASALLFTSAASAATALAPGSTWDYTFTDPTGDPSWNTTTGVGGIWASGGAPFGNVVGGDFGYVTFWPADGDLDDDLWVRTAVDLSSFDLTTITYDLGVDNGFKLYLNGNLVASDNAEGYTFRWEYSSGVPAGFLLPGLNVVAVALEDHGGLTAFDMQLTGRLTPVIPEAGNVLAGLALAGAAGTVLWRRRAARA